MRPRAPLRPAPTGAADRPAPIRCTRRRTRPSTKHQLTATEKPPDRSIAHQRAIAEALGLRNFRDISFREVTNRPAAENLARQDLDPVQEAGGYERLRAAGLTKKAEGNRAIGL